MVKLLVFLFAFVWFRGHAAPLPLRPADGPRLEGPHPAGAVLAALHRRHRFGRAGTGRARSSLGGSSSVAPLAGRGAVAAPLAAHAKPSSRRWRPDGLPRGLRRHVYKSRQMYRRTSSRPSIPYEKKPKPDRFHGRHVLNRYEDGMEKCIGCELCAGVCPARCIYVRGADNPPDDPGLARRALRLRLRDQLPALHPLRPVRRGLPHRGHHRVEAVRVLLHQPPTPSTPRPSWWSTTTASPAAAAVGGLARATTSTPRRGCGPLRRPATPTTRAQWVGRASSATACAPRRRPGIDSLSRAVGELTTRRARHDQPSRWH